MGKLNEENVNRLFPLIHTHAIFCFRDYEAENFYLLTHSPSQSKTIVSSSVNEFFFCEMRGEKKENHV